MASPADVEVVRVFPNGKGGGNPAPIVLDAHCFTDSDMRTIATRFGHESGFIFPADDDRNHFKFRFFVPNHEMEMCGHATIGALWLLRARGRVSVGRYRIETLSGIVTSDVPCSGPIAISQPVGRTGDLCAPETSSVLGVLGLEKTDLSCERLINASTSRTKTLVPIASLNRLHSIAPDFEQMKDLCERIGSTGLYPFAAHGTPGTFSARQFPRSSGYPEDAATGIAATALTYGLLDYGSIGPRSSVTVFQGEAMGRPSRIDVALYEDGCILTGDCERAEISADRTKQVVS
ncbi:MAG: PhzF family phenazine biosynthesis protein [Pseudomonadota bacterium]